jgi:hypothetical protein
LECALSHFRNQRRSDNRCLYAAGYSIPEIVNILKGRIFNFSNILIKRQGLFAMKGFHDIYKNFSPPILWDLKIPLYVTATDIKRRVGLLFVRKSIPIVNGFFLYTYVVPTCTVQEHLVCGRRY